MLLAEAKIHIHCSQEHGDIARRSKDIQMHREAEARRDVLKEHKHKCTLFKKIKRDKQEAEKKFENAKYGSNIVIDCINFDKQFYLSDNYEWLNIDTFKKKERKKKKKNKKKKNSKFRRLMFVPSVSLYKSTSRQRSGKGAIRKDSHSKNRGGKNQTNNQVLIP